MKDLDFDELDRAVNSLMAGVPKQAAPGDQPAEKTLTISDTSHTTSLTGNNANTASQTPTTASLNVSPTSPSVSNTPAARRGGRFMDVVHPSSDMKKPEAPAERSVSRQGATIEPKDIPSPAPQTSAAPAVPLEVPSVPLAPKSPAPKETPRSGDWPDPLEMAGFDNAPASEPIEKKEEKKAAPVVTTPAKPDPDTPLISPFLADTKVDKRPLGANAISASESSEKEATESAVLPLKETDDQLPATLEDTRPILPAELHDDLMAIESDTTEPLPSEEKAVAESPVITPVALPAEPLEVKEDLKEKHSTDKEKKEDKPVPLPTGPVSIPQQYKEEPSSEEPKSGAIYDTDTYHKPLDHPAKQKSGWMWVVWIVLILILGAGIGAALYFLGIVR